MSAMLELDFMRNALLAALFVGLAALTVELPLFLPMAVDDAPVANSTNTPLGWSNGHDSRIIRTPTTWRVGGMYSVSHALMPFSCCWPTGM